MKTLYLILVIAFYVIGVLIGVQQKINGDQSKVSQREGKYPIITSLNPLGQPTVTLVLMGLFIYLYFNY
tara:strand:+ start:417 stop:623 length:207 start_codon:yes stop_codon:yes gene_type:complete